MRKSTVFLTFIAINLVVLAAFTFHSFRSAAPAAAGRSLRAGLVRKLGLTDLCLFTEARYTRNPALADVHSPFQDHPCAFEHFPSGSLVTPPGRLSPGREVSR